jgi:hypothetical protein
MDSVRTNPPKPVAMNDLLRQTTALQRELAAAMNRVLASGCGTHRGAFRQLSPE